MTSRKTLVTLSLLTLFCVAAAPLHAQNFLDLYDFNCNTGGCDPSDYSGLAQGTDGNLYGTDVGADSQTEIFMVTPSGTHTDLLALGDVLSPVTSGLTLASDGNFYGTTCGGGTSNAGTVFRFTPPSSLTTLHNFNITDGYCPSSPPIQGKDGNLYGVTAAGTTYRVKVPAGTFTQLSNNAPYRVNARLLLASDGNFYGTTEFGGTFNDGTVFSHDHNWLDHDLHVRVQRPDRPLTN